MCSGRGISSLGLVEAAFLSNPPRYPFLFKRAPDVDWDLQTKSGASWISAQLWTGLGEHGRPREIERQSHKCVRLVE